MGKKGVKKKKKKKTKKATSSLLGDLGGIEGASAQKRLRGESNATGKCLSNIVNGTCVR